MYAMGGAGVGDESKVVHISQSARCCVRRRHGRHIGCKTPSTHRSTACTFRTRYQASRAIVKKTYLVSTIIFDLTADALSVQRL